jgi:hypothetical protein
MLHPEDAWHEDLARSLAAKIWREAQALSSRGQLQAKNHNDARQA